ncbi:MAG TPA: LysE family translocator [Sphingomicrobium sp.]|nr:LysE family translocator [Sphingomicrobium sp.]
MTIAPALLAFLIAATILTITPGLDTALVLRSAAAGGTRPAAFAAIGIALGCLVWGAIVAIGLGALLAASELAYAVLRWAGAAYLLWLGFHLVLRPRRRFDAPAHGDRRPDQWEALRQGFFTNLLNPKVGIFYISFLPQFVPAGTDVATFTFLLAAIHVLLGLIWFSALIVATVPIARLLRRPAVVRVMDRLTGGLFIMFGAKLVVSR